MTSPRDKKVIKLLDYKRQKKVNNFAKTHLDMERAWQYSCNLLESLEIKGLDPVNVRLSLYKLMVMKLQMDGYDYHSLHRILLHTFDDESK